ncbi:MAG: ferritin-like domain-containing protein [Acidocella sp.]|nr:ferritin-like domain-containing protein [Acidocella sp.]
MFEQAAIRENHFLQDIECQHAAARACLQAGWRGPEQSVALLQTALAVEIACVLRYSMMSVSREGLESIWAGIEFQAQAADERAHMQRIAARILALGGKPDYAPVGLASRHVAPDSAEGALAKRLEENLAAEHCVMELYRELIAHFEDADPDSAALLREIAEDEEAHASDMEDLLATYRC